MSDVVVIGAGVIGLGIAWRCAQRGAVVTVVDPAPGSGASNTAAGMLAPVTELHFGEAPLLDLNLDSAARYPGFVAELTEATGLEVGYVQCGTVVAAWDAADLSSLQDLQRYATSLGRRSELLTGRELRREVPALAAGLPGGLLARDDHQVDNRLLINALLLATERAGARIVHARASAVVTSNGRAIAVRTDDGERLDAGTVVLAAGAWSRQLDGVPDAALPPVRPVKGQTVRLRASGPPLLPHIVRGSVKGSPVYIVPRTNGELVIGASSEDAGFDTRPRAGAVYELLRDAQSLVPLLGEAELVEVSTSVRPGSPDNAPIVGPSGLDGLIVATGHYRNGILLTPVTADGIAALIADGTLPEVLAPFTPDRFSVDRLGTDELGTDRLGTDRLTNVETSACN
ncbi:MAG TPA: glycine oxidase ThiO [Jatrophihabitans sp.]|jgi:glycine oxidase